MGANDYHRLCWSQNGSKSIAASKEPDSSTVRILTDITQNIIDILHVCSIFESKPLFLPANHPRAPPYAGARTGPSFGHE